MSKMSHDIILQVPLEGDAENNQQKMVLSKVSFDEALEQETFIELWKLQDAIANVLPWLQLCFFSTVTVYLENKNGKIKK